MNNRRMGNSFEEELCETLYSYGFWTTNLAQKKSGQPADVIAVKNYKAYLIDAKVCINNAFPFSRIEENQDLSMELWKECGNGTGWFALKTDDGIYMMSHFAMKIWRRFRASLSRNEITGYGTPIERWVKECK